MKWFQHESNSSMDSKLQQVLLDYGLDGYGLYWYCLELIAAGVDKNNLTFELEHDARIIAHRTGSTTRKIEEMMKKFVSLGLFENSDGIITCLSMAKKCDEYTSKLLRNQRDTNIPTESGECPDSVPTKSRIIEYNTIEKKIKNNNSSSEESREKKYTAQDLELAAWMFERIKQVAPKTREPNMDAWADTIRLMGKRDKLSHREIAEVFRWANNDDFWSTNILSPQKLRKQFSALHAKKNAKVRPTPLKSTDSPMAALKDRSWAKGMVSDDDVDNFQDGFAQFSNEIHDIYGDS